MAVIVLCKTYYYPTIYHIFLIRQREINIITWVLKLLITELISIGIIN